MKKALKINEFSHKSVLSNPKDFLAEALQDLCEAWALGLTFFTRDLKAQYRLSFLGLFWSTIPPLVFVIGFSVAAKANIINFGDTPIPYPAFAMVSIMIWHLFQSCVEAPILAFKDAKPLIGRLRFSVESIFISKIYMVLFNLVIKAIFVAAALIYFEIPIGWGAFNAFFPLISLMIFGLFLGVLLAPITLLIDDVAQGLKFFMTFWMIATPVAYVIDRSSEHYGYMVFNPAAALVATLRENLLSLPLNYETPFYIVTILGLVGLICAWLAAKIALPFITERAGTV